MGADSTDNTKSPRRVLRTATVTRSGHTWRFVWSPGDEPAVIAAACAEARHTASPMRFADAALLANKIANRAASKQLAFVSNHDPAGDEPPRQEQ